MNKKQYNNVIVKRFRCIVQVNVHKHVSVSKFEQWMPLPTVALSTLSMKHA